MCPAGDILAGPVAETLPVLNWLRLKGPYRLSSTIGPSGLGTPPLRSRLTANFAADLIGLSALKTTWASPGAGSTAKTPLFTGEGDCGSVTPSWEFIAAASAGSLET